MFLLLLFQIYQTRAKAETALQKWDLGFLLLSSLSLNSAGSWGAIGKVKLAAVSPRPQPGCSDSWAGDSRSLGALGSVTSEPGALLRVPERHLLPLLKWQPWAAIAGKRFLGSWGAKLCVPPSPPAAPSPGLQAGSDPGFWGNPRAWIYQHRANTRTPRFFPGADAAQNVGASPKQRRATRRYSIPAALHRAPCWELFVGSK